MADLYTAPQIMPRLPQQEGITLLEEAITRKDWETLKPYPQLLFFYQTKYKDEVMSIAKWVSHFRTGKHKWCIENCTNSNYLGRDKEADSNRNLPQERL